MVKAGVAVSALAACGAIFASQAGAASVATSGSVGGGGTSPSTSGLILMDTTAQYFHDVLVTSGDTQLGCVRVGPISAGTAVTVPNNTPLTVTEFQEEPGDCFGGVIGTHPILKSVPVTVTVDTTVDLAQH